MKKSLVVTMLWLCAVGAWGDARWVTYKTSRDANYGLLQHQIDRGSIRQAGPYRTFAMREWIVEKQQPMMFTINDRLFFVSRTYAVDCAQRRFGDRFIDSQNVRERGTPLARLHWTALDKLPAIARTVCR